MTLRTVFAALATGLAVAATYAGTGQAWWLVVLVGLASCFGVLGGVDVAARFGARKGMDDGNPGPRSDNDRSESRGAGRGTSILPVLLIAAFLGCGGSGVQGVTAADFAPAVAISGELAAAICEALGGDSRLCEGLRLAGGVGSVACGWFGGDDGDEAELKCLEVQEGDPP